MPAFGKDGILKPDDIHKVVDYVRGLSAGTSTDKDPGYTIFQTNCAACHGTDAKGNQSMGAPNLADKIWLYGGDEQTVYETVYGGRGGVMPYWKGRLSDDTLRELAVYVYSLGGGVPSDK